MGDRQVLRVAILIGEQRQLHYADAYLKSLTRRDRHRLQVLAERFEGWRMGCAGVFMTIASVFGLIVMTIVVGAWWGEGAAAVVVFAGTAAFVTAACLLRAMQLRTMCRRYLSRYCADGRLTHCPRCDYPTTGLSGTACPECGEIIRWS
jgi:hypothetical protein